MKTTVRLILLGLTGLSLFQACSKNDSSGGGPVKVDFYLTDAPTQADYKSIWIDVQSISYSTNDISWINLPITPRMVDVLKFSNGADTLLSNIQLDAGVKVHQIRLLLGQNNKLELNDGTIHDLGTPSGQTSGLKINVQSTANVTSGYKVVIDFDATRSIVAKGNGTYSLKPVIRAFIEANTSSISGNILPDDVPTRIFTVTAAQDTVATISDTARNNLFVLRGLPTGVYDIKGQDLTTDQIFLLKSGVNIIGGTNAEVGNLQLPL